MLASLISLIILLINWSSGPLNTHWSFILKLFSSGRNWNAYRMTEVYRKALCCRWPTSTSRHNTVLDVSGKRHPKTSKISLYHILLLVLDRILSLLNSIIFISKLSWPICSKHEKDWKTDNEQNIKELISSYIFNGKSEIKKIL